MDINDHLKTWNGFVAFTKWGLVFNILVLIFLAIFRTHS
ncbi:MAG: aa3-type cytochrome c oxidase subunit IV [Pseudomonadota bacterium]|nr:aa3-type cytochrome c oxidase subunit IV [Pseudomonadota bacterium]